MSVRPARTARVAGAAFRVVDDEGAFWARAEAGAWEPEALAIVADAARAGAVLVDVGAWVGPLTLVAAAHGARVLAVEADPAALADLRANLAANPELAPRVTLIARAAAARPGPVRLGARRRAGDSMSSVLLADAPGAWTAEAATPGELAALLRPGERPLVTIDVEGGEYELLPALGPLLDRPGAACLVSLHPEALAAGVDARRAGEAALAILDGWSARPVDGEGAPVGERLRRAGSWLFERLP